ncbi:MAG: hypothetical protein L0Y38_04400 [Methylococcaceae bacterium]|nr:hypothetical protein [Methylococcaceae bacterium]MCI0668561.1 hypothetical protein [Methylococcaceae bacterium]MCI0733050.1 hypothetical protein [Methylococcaceae bacterium]
MKFIFFVLVSLNVVLFVWEYFGHERSGSLTDAALRRIEDPSIERIILAGEIPATKEPTQFDTHKGRPSGFNPARSDLDPVVFQSFNQGLFESIDQQSTSLVEDFLESEVIRQINGYQKGSVIGFPEAPDSISVVQAGESSGFTAGSERLCYRLGPRSSGASFSRIAADFRQLGLAPMAKAERIDVESGFMVLYPAAESFEASKANVKMLNDRGLRDLWMINEGTLRGGISLGFFKTRERAAVLQKELEAKQIEARVEAKLSERTAYFLVFPWHDAAGELPARLHGSGFEATELQVIDPGNCKP